MKYWWYSLLVLGVALSYPMNDVLAQHRLVLYGAEKDTFEHHAPIPTNFPSAEECRKALFQSTRSLLRAGFAETSIDSLSVTDSLTQAWVHTGKKYQWGVIRSGNISALLQANSKFETTDMYNKPLQINDLSLKLDRILRWLENNGYPFAYLQLDSLTSDSNQRFHATLRLEQGPVVKIDSVILNEDAPVSKAFVMRYLGLTEGMLYQEEKIQQISARLRELSFIRESFPWRIQFHISKTKLYITLAPRNANRADVLIGLLPRNEELGGKFLLTGDIKLAFTNALSQGESVQLNWQNLQYQSPRYDIKLNYPYLFNSPFGINGSFNFYKKDSSFKNVQGELGLVYAYQSNNYLKAYYELASTRVGSINVPNLLLTRQLPAIADVTYRSFGLDWMMQHVDYRLNPRRGYIVQLEGLVSARNFIRNTTVEETFDAIAGKSFGYLYDSIPKRSYKYVLKTNLQGYLPLHRRVVMASKLLAGFTLSSQTLFRNELFQIGGFRLLRGFDEGSLFVTSYQVLTLEPRLLLSTNSYFFLFSDLSRTTAIYYGSNRTDYPYSIGGGMVFETRAGLFNMAYGVGGRNEVPLQFRSSKIHFGYVAVF